MDAFNLVARLTLDTSEYDAALDKVNRRDLPELSEQAEETTIKVNKLGSSLGKAFKAVGAAAGAALAAGAAGAAALVKQSTDAYANYQQLVGGVETLFSNLEGTVSSAPKVLENAANAYKTAGMSANQYMETVTAFSAALVSSLEGDYNKAADISDMAIRDMSDNANKMGTSMESIQNAYQGFAKQNYTMLDNLKLGYGGTKSEMERLIEDAEKLDSSFKAQRDENGKLALSLDDVYNAIHIVQQEMGITGTTAKEAGSTITGSLGSLSAAWENLVAGFADANADLPALINNVVDAAEGSFGNLLPIAEQAVKGLSEFIGSVAPIIAEKLPSVADEIISPLLDTANSVVNTLIQAIPDFLGTITDIAPKIITDFTASAIDLLPKLGELGSNMVTSLANGLTIALPQLIPAATSAIDEFVNTLTNPETLTDILNAGADLLQTLSKGIADAIPQLADSAVDLVLNFADFILDPENITKIVTTAHDIITNLKSGLIAAIPRIAEGALELVGKIIDTIINTDWIKVGGDIVNGIADGIINGADRVREAAFEVGKDIYNKMNEGANDFDSEHWIEELSGGYFSYINEMTGEAEQALVAFANKYADVITDTGEGFAFNFTGEEDVDYVLSVLDDLMTAYEETGKSADELSAAYYSLERARNNISVTASDEAERTRTEQTMLQLEQATYQSANHFDIYDKFIKPKIDSAKEETAKGIAEIANVVKEEWDGSFATLAIGDYRNLGVVEQLGKVLSEDEEKANKIASQVYSASQTYVNRLVNQQDLTIEEQIKLWEQVQAQFVNGSKQYLDAGDKIISLQRKQADEAKKTEEKRTKEQQEELNKRQKALEDYQKQVDKINEEIADIQKKYDDALESETQRIYNSYSLFDKVPERLEVSGIDLMNNLTGQIDTLKKFYSDLDKLQERGVSSALVDEIRGMGVKAADNLDALLDLSDEELQKYDQLYDEKNKFASEQAEKDLESLNSEKNQKIAEKMSEIDALTEEQGGNLGLTFMQAIADGITNGADLVKNATGNVFSNVTSFISDAVGSFSMNTSTGNKNNAVKSGGITVNVNGIQYQNMEQLAKAISEMMQLQLERGQAGYAGA